MTSSSQAAPVLDTGAAARLALTASCGAACRRRALAAVAVSVAWTQTAIYRQDPPGGGFLDGYAHAAFLGRTDGEPPPASMVPAAVGLLLTPGVIYRTMPTPPTRSI